ncbi:metal ABC transporter substrate-binding protein [Halorubrum sp. BOL3-1]|uniref:metal ABC transporter substrate-binding protein n=1 Tax=Halorubrum sp. BOL3-1 TaxID=2497325 RepID=UPI00140E0189|nr:metal ABC transporter substrate-binding protein [Halorubrum sp. BOL3-1]
MSLAVLATDEGGDHGIEHVEETARELYASDHETHTVVKDEDTLSPSQDSLYILEFSDSGETNFSLDIDTEGHYVLFSQHVPAEFAAALTDSGGAAIEPETSETAGGHDHEDEHDHEGEDEHEDEHDHGAMDPHFWLDPQRAAQAVGALEATFAEMDGENAEVYADNAAAYRDQLEELDSEIQSVADDASKNTLFVAGHDAFQYLEDRYGLRVESLTGLSPDDQPTPRDIERAQDIIDEHGLAHVCADPLESQTAAEQLVEETDATGMLPLTAIPGQTGEWADNDWGYIEIMENINLDTLETALNA